MALETMKVMVNGMPRPVAEKLALMISESNDMRFIPISLSRSFDNKVIIKNPKSRERPLTVRLAHIEETNFLTNDQIPDIIVDLFFPARIKRSVKNYYGINSSFIIQVSSRDDYLFISEEIRNKNINVVIAPVIKLEEVLRAIRYLFDKKLSGKFGTVFYMEEILKEIASQT